MINNNCSKWVFRSKDLDQLDKVRRVGDLGDTIPRVIKKKPTKAQIKIYFLNIFKTKEWFIQLKLIKMTEKEELILVKMLFKAIKKKIFQLWPN